MARLEFAEGAHARLRIPVPAVTDIDILSLDVDSRLRVSRSSLECKSGKGQSGEPDTILWLAGFRQLLDLDRVTLVRQVVSPRGQSLARKLKIVCGLRRVMCHTCRVSPTDSQTSGALG